jgi:hypothetical protein
MALASEISFSKLDSVSCLFHMIIIYYEFNLVHYDKPISLQFPFQVMTWMLVHEHMPPSDQLQTLLELLAVTLQSPQLSSVIGQIENSSLLCSCIGAVHQLVISSKFIS